MSLLQDRRRAERRRDEYYGHPPGAPSYPDYIDDDLRDIKSTLHLRWQELGVLKLGEYNRFTGKYAVLGSEGRWELWDQDAEGQWYKISTLDDDGRFVQPTAQLVDFIRKINPARQAQGVHDVTRKYVDEPNEAYEAAKLRDSDQLIDDSVESAMAYQVPKSYAGQKYRGDKLLGAGGMSAIDHQQKVESPKKRLIILPGEF